MHATTIPNRRTHRGFTLIELMITMAIVAILAAVAIPSYRDYVTVGSLPEATTNLASLRARMEQAFLDNRTYGTGTTCSVPMPVVDTTKDKFTFTCVTSSNNTAYLITATGVTGKTAAGFVFTIDQNGVQQTTALPASWAAGTTLPVARWITKKGG